MLGHRKTEAMYQFLISENAYNLVFYSTREMHQVNVRTGTQRQVKRRPEKPISDDDLKEWYGYLFMDIYICKSTVNAIFYSQYTEDLSLTHYKLAVIRGLIRI